LYIEFKQRVVLLALEYRCVFLMRLLVTANRVFTHPGFFREFSSLLTLPPKWPVLCRVGR